MKTPAAIRREVRLSKPTLALISRTEPTLDRELASVRSLFDWHEDDGWRQFSQEDYDTIFPELRQYIGELEKEQA